VSDVTERIEQQDTASPGTRWSPQTGRYVGSNGRYWLELRVDWEERGLVSGDIQSTGPDARGGYASFRSVDGADIREGMPVEWVAGSSQPTSGTVFVEPSEEPSDRLTARLELDHECGLIPARQPIDIVVAFVSTALRELDLRVSTEVGVDDGVEDRVTTLAHGVCKRFRDAGLDVRPRFDSARVRPPEAGWSESEIFAALHDVMSRSSDVPLRPEWDLQLLVLSRTKTDGMLGIMFDIDDELPRQGAAVFVQSLDATDRQADRVIHNAVHELGHGLNLRHSFDREVRDSASLSYMNYDWRFRGGGRENIEAYWTQTPDETRRFSDSELAFLLHAPRAEVIPGGSPFGSARYWPLEDPGAAPEPPWSDLRLWLTPPLGGTTFGYGQPICLAVSLLNTGEESVAVPRHVLDVKAGQLDMMVRPLDRRARDTGSRAFAPLMRRCFEEVEGSGTQITLSKGESLHNNLNLSYGSEGFTCPDPGDYEVTPVLSFSATSQDERDQIVVGRSLRITVARPQGRAEEREAETLLGRSDVGVWMALGGTRPLGAAAGDLQELRERRERRSGADGVVAALARFAGIATGREGDGNRAARLLAKATEARAGAAFDPHTLQHTRRLAARYRRSLTPQDASLVVVDLWSRPPSGGPSTGGRGPGFLIIPKDKRSGELVLAPAKQLPRDAVDGDSDIFATVAALSADGLTERISVKRVDLVCGQDDSGDARPEIVLLQLSRPGLIGSVGDREPRPTVTQDSRLSDFFYGDDARFLEAINRATLADISGGADSSNSTAPSPWDPTESTSPAPHVHRYGGDGAIGLNDVASWRCWLCHCCAEEQPPDDLEKRYVLGRDPGDGTPAR